MLNLINQKIFRLAALIVFMPLNLATPVFAGQSNIQIERARWQEITGCERELDAQAFGEGYYGYKGCTNWKNAVEGDNFLNFVRNECQRQTANSGKQQCTIRANEDWVHGLGFPDVHPMWTKGLMVKYRCSGGSVKFAVGREVRNSEPEVDASLDCE